MTHRRLIILQAALCGVLLSDGIDQNSWPLIALGAAGIVLAIADGGAERTKRPPAANWTERILRYFGLR
jgi:hypothetical protein